MYTLEKKLKEFVQYNFVIVKRSAQLLLLLSTWMDKSRYVKSHFRTQNDAIEEQKHVGRKIPYPQF